MKKKSFGQPCEGAIWYILPYIRAGLARELANLGLTQEEIAEELGLTQAAVSQYKRGKRGKIEELDEEVHRLIKNVADGISDEGIKNLPGKICIICNHIKEDPELLRHCGVEEEEVEEEGSACRLEA